MHRHATAIASVFATALATSAAVSAQDPRGIWSGTIHTDTEHHVVMKIDGPDTIALRATLYQDERGTDLPVDTISFDGNVLDLSAIRGAVRLHAVLDAGGSTLHGTVTLKSSTPLELHRTTEAAAWTTDTSTHTISRIETDRGVSLEVLDWGGSGPPALLLTGLGNNAHIYDKLAPELAKSFHVYGITRRGAGASTWPAPLDENYTANRLGTDVTNVIRALHLDRPLVIGHSIAGEELSYLGDTSPELIRGLVYLDAGYAYAYFDEAHPDFTISLNDVRRKLATVRVAVPPQQLTGTMTELANSDLPRFQALLKAQVDLIHTFPKSTDGPVTPPPPSAFEAIINGEQKFAAPRCPVLAIYALREDSPRTAQFADSFAAAAPQARVVRLSNANHYVFFSNEADVLKEIRAFAASLPQTAGSTAPH